VNIKDVKSIIVNGTVDQSDKQSSRSQVEDEQKDNGVKVSAAPR